MTRSGASERRSRANPGRVAAARALAAVDEGEHLEDVLPGWLPQHDQDRSLAWHLAFSVLRHRSSIDAALRRVLSRPIEGLDAGVRAALRVGAAELLHGRAKRYAVVDQAVEVARALGVGRASGLVNAALRRLEPEPSPSRADALDHPAWLVARWDERYGREATEAWCLANAEPPPLFVVSKEAGPAVAAAFDAAGVGPVGVSLHGAPLDRVLELPASGGRVDALPGWGEGTWWVQDAASVWMTDLVPTSCRTVLDACAAPGGKTFRLASRGAAVTSTDVSEGRLEALQEGLARLGMQATVGRHDWTQGPMPGLGSFEAVLVDAPCTGLGTVRRHPEIRWRRGPFDSEGAAKRQRVILEHAAQHVAPSGCLVYVVCSPEPEEGPEVVADFLDAHPEFELDEERSTAPPERGEDAFFGVRLVRR